MWATPLVDCGRAEADHAPEAWDSAAAAPQALRWMGNWPGVRVCARVSVHPRVILAVARAELWGPWQGLAPALSARHLVVQYGTRQKVV